MIGAGTYLEYCLSVLQEEIHNTLCVKLENLAIRVKAPIYGYDGNLTVYDLEQYAMLDLALQIITT